MCNWFTKLFCGKNCKCHEEKKPVEPQAAAPSMNASNEVKATPENLEPKM